MKLQKGSRKGHPRKLALSLMSLAPVGKKVEEKEAHREEKREYSDQPPTTEGSKKRERTTMFEDGGRLDRRGDATFIDGER